MMLFKRKAWYRRPKRSFRITLRHWVMTAAAKIAYWLSPKQ
jgi:hypothetical protein